MCWAHLILPAPAVAPPLPTSPVHYVTALLLLVFISTTETGLLSGLLAHSNLRAESSPSPVLSRERHDCGNPGPILGRAWGPFLGGC